MFKYHSEQMLKNWLQLAHVYFTEASIPILCASSDTHFSIYEITTLHWLLKPAFVKPRTCNIIGQGRDNVQTKWSVMKTLNSIIVDVKICDPLCENPAKVIFLWYFFYKRKSSFIW